MGGEYACAETSLRYRAAQNAVINNSKKTREPRLISSKTIKRTNTGQPWLSQYPHVPYSTKIPPSINAALLSTSDHHVLRAW